MATKTLKLMFVLSCLVVWARDTLLDNSFSQLRLASGSLAQYLAVKHSNKLGSASTVDEVEGTLAKFIPPGDAFDFWFVYY